VNETSNFFGSLRWRWVDVDELRYCGCSFILCLVSHPNSCHSITSYHHNKDIEIVDAMDETPHNCDLLYSYMFQLFMEIHMDRAPSDGSMGQGLE